MLLSLLKISLRIFRKHKMHSSINILGLTIGLACSMLIIIYILDEFGFECFHKNADRIFRIGREVSSTEGEMREPLSSAPTAAILLRDYPEVVDAVRFRNLGRVFIRYDDKQFYEKRIYYADVSVFQVFTYPLISGDPQTALLDPYTVVITREMANKYFANEDPIGKTLKFNNCADYIVTGIMENVPDNTDLEINMLCSFATLHAQKDPTLQDWLTFDYSTYILLAENYHYKELERKFPALIHRYIGERSRTTQGMLNFYLHPLLKIHLYSHLDGNSPGLTAQVIFFSFLALFITLIACINFMNLSTARATTRAKEVGLRKVIGAGKQMLIRQFLGEAVITSLLALAVAFLLVELALPSFSNIIGRQLEFSISAMPGLFMVFIGLAVFTGLVAGSYPAFYLSRFQPAQVLKGRVTMRSKGSRLRSILVVAQFILSTILICQTGLIRNQLRYMKTRDIGFNKKHVVVLPVIDEDTRQSISNLKNEFRNVTNVLSVAAVSDLPGLNVPRNVKIPQGYSRHQVQLMDDISIDHDFVPTMGIEVVSGRNFIKESTAEHKYSIIINETAARKYGWKDPIGKTIRHSLGEDKYATSTVIGIVRDFHLASMHRIIEPLFIDNNPENLKYVLIRIRPDDTAKTLEHIKTVWYRVNPNHPFAYSMLEDSYDRYFRTIEYIIEILLYVSILAILLASTGIFALAVFIAEQRTKEIGIRKVLGDSTLGIALRFNKELLKYVLLASLFLVPYSQIPLVNLEKFFPYPANISFTIYFQSALLIFLIAFASISYQSIKAAMSNPVKSLRYE